MPQTTSTTLAKFKHTIDQVAGDLLVTDKAGRIIYANRAMERRTGYMIDEMIGRSPGKLWGGNMPDNFYAKLWSNIKEKKRPFHAIVKNKHKTKYLYDQNLLITPVLDKRQDINYFLAVYPNKSGSLLPTHLSDAEEMSRWLLSALSNTIVSRRQVRSLIEESGFGKEFFQLLQHGLIEPTRQAIEEKNDDWHWVVVSKTDAESFGKIYQKYTLVIKKYFLRRVGEKNTADDLTQETFTHAFAHRAAFKPDRHVPYSSYLFNIAHNLLVSWYRSYRATSRLDENSFPYPQINRQTPIIYWDARLVTKMLKDSAASIITMRYKADLSIHEIALKIGKSDNAVKLQLARARKILAKKIKDIEAENQT